jgi:hypothetical protein
VTGLKSSAAHTAQSNSFELITAERTDVNSDDDDDDDDDDDEERSSASLIFLSSKE